MVEKPDSSSTRLSMHAGDSFVGRSAVDALVLDAVLSHQFKQEDRRNAGPVSLTFEFGHAALYSGIQAPIVGTAQLLDRARDTHMAESLSYIKPPEPADFNTPLWYAQQFGSGTGMIVPFAITKRCMKGLGLSLVARQEAKLATMAAPKLMSKAGLAMLADGMATGLVSDFVARPVEAHEGEFWTARGNHALTGMTTLGAITAGSVTVRRIAGPLTSQVFGTKAVLYDFATNALPGIPAGIASADVTARLTHNRWATAEERIEGVVNMTATGGFLGALHRVPGQEVTAAQRAYRKIELAEARANLETSLAVKAKQVALENTPRESRPLQKAPKRAGGRSIGIFADLERGLAFGGADVEQTGKEVAAPKEVTQARAAVISKGLQMAFDAAAPESTPQQVAEFFRFAKNEGVGERDMLLEYGKQCNDERMLTLIREAYLPDKGVENRVVPGDPIIEPNQKPTPDQLKRWHQFRGMIERAPNDTDIDNYANFRHNVFIWLNTNQDLLPWARQLADQTQYSKVAGPLEFYFGTKGMKRFSDVSDGKTVAARKAPSVDDINTMKAQAGDFADEIGRLPYEDRMIESFQGAAAKVNSVNHPTEIARAMNQALSERGFQSHCQVGVDAEGNLALYKYRSETKVEPISTVDYTGAEVTVNENATVQQARDVAVWLAQKVASGRSIAEAEWAMAQAAYNFRELGVDIKDVPKLVNPAMEHFRIKNRVHIEEGGRLSLNYVTKTEGLFPIATANVNNSGN